MHAKLHAPKNVALKESQTDLPALTVSQLTQQIERAIKQNIAPVVLVRGEVSNWNHHRQSGHCYFTLKDASSCIDCVMFKDAAGKLKFAPGDGMELLATGRVGVYGQRGKYQLYASSLQPLGQGALELAFQQLKAKLEKEGLFAAERKKPLPSYPQRIALVTSRSTAALQDMLKVLRTFAHLRIFLYHVPVQGDGSAEKIADAIDHLSACRASFGIDLAIVARGGGSLEDLWEFNEEIVSRAIARSRLAIVTGIGHEVDVSIADLVADYHAHTPTEAARVVTAHWKNAADSLHNHQTRLHRQIASTFEESRTRLVHISRHEFFRRPIDLIQMRRQRLDDLQRSLHMAIQQRLGRLHRKLTDAATTLERHRPSAILAERRETLVQLERKLSFALTNRLRYAREDVHAIDRRLQDQHPRHRLRLARQQVDHIQSLLESYNPTNVLRRGYSITSLKKTGAVARSAATMKGGETIITRFADGTIESVVDDPKQPKLF